MPRISKRPGTVTAAAVILFVLGAWALLGGICGGGGIAVLSAMPEPAGVAGKAQVGDPAAPHRFIVKEVPGYLPIIFSMLAVDVLISLVLVGCGIGLLRLSSTARTMTILLLIGKLLFAIGGSAYQIVFVLPVQERFFKENPQIPGGSLTGAFAMGGVALAVAFQLVIALIIIILISTANARLAFANASLPQVDDDRPRRRDDGYDDDYDAPGSSRDTGITDRSS